MFQEFRDLAAGLLCVCLIANLLAGDIYLILLLRALG